MSTAVAGADAIALRRRKVCPGERPIRSHNPSSRKAALRRLNRWNSQGFRSRRRSERIHASSKGTPERIRTRLARPRPTGRHRRSQGRGLRLVEERLRRRRKRTHPATRSTAASTTRTSSPISSRRRSTRSASLPHRPWTRTPAQPRFVAASVRRRPWRARWSHPRAPNPARTWRRWLRSTARG